MFNIGLIQSTKIHSECSMQILMLQQMLRTYDYHCALNVN